MFWCLASLCRAKWAKSLLVWSIFLFPMAALCADAVLDWNALLLDDIRADDSSPTLSTRTLAIMHTSMYDAVNSVLRTHQPYKFQLNAPADTSAEAAAVGAAYEVTKTFYPALAGWADTLYQTWLASVPPDDTVSNGLTLGQTIAQLMLQDRAYDGSSTDIPYIPSADPGQWRRTPPYFRPPLAPQWRYVTPFCLRDLEPFVPPPPPALESPEYAASFNEVQDIGKTNSTSRTAEQRQIAVFWSDFSYTAMPPGHWHEITSKIAAERGLTLADNARLFALISLAQADAAITCWETKYRYNLWRPVTAIVNGNLISNPLTQADSSWGSLLAAPSFPSYTSGHSTFSKASAQVLTHFFGTDAVNFTATSDSLPGVTRSFSSFAACADEVGMSRIYGGIHFAFDNVQGKECGRKIGDYVSANFLLPNAVLPLVAVDSFSNNIPLLRLHGRIDSSIILQVSSDLKAWQTISTNAAAPGGVLVSDTQAHQGSSRFYRATQSQ